MELNRHGAALFPAVVDADARGDLLTAIGPVQGRAGYRFPSLKPLSRWIGLKGQVGAIAAGILGRTAKPVRAILFDKSEQVNWSLGWHQDRTVAVAARADVPGFGPWTTKGGIPHVEPPFRMIERMITLRVHLDAVEGDNAPLLISPGTHAAGKLTTKDLKRAVDVCGQYACLADAGDVWAYRTSIVHASLRSAAKRTRRVLQVDYCAEALPPPLRWLGETA